MATLTLVPGGRPMRPPFSMNARGIAKYMIASAYAARKVIENYAFPKEDKAKIILRVPAKDVIFRYFKGGQDAEILHDAIAEYSVKPPTETPFARSRRNGAVAAAKTLLKIGSKFKFRDVHKKACNITIQDCVPARGV